MAKLSNLFFNRELSWIEFNARVLNEARRQDKPLMERLKFLAIVSSNFDEFFMVRVAGLKRQGRHQPRQLDVTGLTAQKQLDKITQLAHKVVQLQYETLMKQIIPGLAREGIQYVPPKAYNFQQSQFTKKMFLEDIFPLLTPIRTNGPVFHHIANLKLHGAFVLQPSIKNKFKTSPFTLNKKEKPVAILQIPAGIPRVVVLPPKAPTTSDSNGEIQFALLDDIIYQYAQLLFPGYKVKEGILFKITRDADFAIDADETNLAEAIESVLEKRQFSLPVRLLCTKTSNYLKDFLLEKLNLAEEDLYLVDGPIDPATLLDLTQLPQAATHSFPKWEHFYPPLLKTGESLWDILKQRDILLHVPFESYDPVIDFLNSAADDDKTLAIKMTLYRTSGDSPIISALERAAQRGKQVEVFVELKARFDEKQNLSWADRLRKAGVNVIQGIVHLKVHAKILLVIRKEETGLCSYIHLSTGNYNDKTAKFYVDLSLFTTNKEFAEDAAWFFTIVSGYSLMYPMKRMFMAPTTLKNRLLELIDREIHHAKKKGCGLIIAKMNSLGQEEIIQKLYQASRAGVKILLNVRGICMLVPGVPGQSENIQVISLIDRYLEHSRIFYFQNGGEEELYLSSADWMPRNMDRRVELMFPILQEEIFKDIKKVLLMYFEDTSQSHQLQQDGSWIPRKPDGEPIRVQEKLQNRYRQRVESCNTMVPVDFITQKTK